MHLCKIIILNSVPKSLKKSFKVDIQSSTSMSAAHIISYTLRDDSESSIVYLCFNKLISLLNLDECTFLVLVFIGDVCIDNANRLW